MALKLLGNYYIYDDHERRRLLLQEAMWWFMAIGCQGDIIYPYPTMDQPLIQLRPTAEPTLEPSLAPTSEPTVRRYNRYS